MKPAAEWVKKYVEYLNSISVHCWPPDREEKLIEAAQRDAWNVALDEAASYIKREFDGAHGIAKDMLIELKRTPPEGENDKQGEQQ